jgi:hypothetical protein
MIDTPCNSKAGSQSLSAFLCVLREPRLGQSFFAVAHEANPRLGRDFGLIAAKRGL